MTGRRPWLVVHSKSYHGLGNRVRVLLGGRVLARAEGRHAVSVWPVNRWFGARLQDLWDVEQASLPAALSRAMSVRFPFQDHDVRTWLDEARRREPILQIRTPHELLLPERVEPWTAELRRLEPARVVRQIVSDFHGTHLAGHAYVGVMVRTHPLSHQETLQASPLSWYVDRLRAIRRRHPGLRFFVSADTPGGLGALRAAVPGCVGLDDKGAYNSRQAVQSSVADVYLMAGSAHVIGPHYSSFPELAQHLAGPDLRLETSRTGAAAAFEAGAVTVAPDPLRPYERTPLDLG